MATISGSAVLGVTITQTVLTPGTYIKIVRHDTSGHYDDVIVRGAYLAPITATTMSFYDFEVPFNTTINYSIYAYSDPEGTTNILQAGSNDLSTTTPTGFVLLTDPVHQGLRVSGSVMSLESWSNQGLTLGSHRVLGRSAPVIVTDLLSSRTGQISIANINSFSVNYDGSGPYTIGQVLESQWAPILETGNVLLFRNDWQTSGFDDCFIHIDSVETTRLSRVLGSYTTPLKGYNLSYTEVERPHPGLDTELLFTWADVRSNNFDWAEVAFTHATWQDVLNDPTL